VRKLANLIQSELKTQEICAVYNSELARVWPQAMALRKRKEQIKRFAKRHELAVTFYDVGLCAIFEKAKGKAGARAKTTERMPLLDDKRRKASRPRRGQ